MCGIVGVISNNKIHNDVAKDIFRTCLVANEGRGKDSTGVLAIDRDSKNYSLFKGLMPSSEFVKRRKFRQAEANVWIGHTRQATTGVVSERNAHPINRKDIFLVHNGMISNHTALGIKENFDYEVDSEVLIPAIEKEDWKLLQEVKGSSNFIAWNKRNNKLYIERHDNPLYCLSLKEYGILAFSSVAEPLGIICVYLGADPEEALFEFPDDHLEFLDMYGQRTKDPMELEFAKVYEYTGKDYSNYGKNEGNRQLTYNSSEYEKDRYPEYYNGFSTDEWEDYVCEGCGCDIDESEFDISSQAWGFGLCYKCLGSINELSRQIRDGGKVDLNKGEYKNFKHILELWLEGDGELNI